MKDIDFEELDRAVNSLMTTVGDEQGTKPDAVDSFEPVVSTAGNSAATTAIDSNASAAPNTATVAPKSDTVVATTTEAPVIGTPLATKRSGRFMDVVHPSSDMRLTSKPSMPNRTAATIQPSSMVELPDEQGNDDTATEPTEELSEKISEIGMDADLNDNNEIVMPDPLDLHMAQEEDQGASEEKVNMESLDSIAAEELSKSLEGLDNAPEVVAETRQEALSDTEDKKIDNPPEEPPISPFLPDAKVEKRPLGGGATAVGKMPSEDDLQETVSGDKEFTGVDTQQPEGATEELSQASETISEDDTVNAALPPELHEDVTAIEAGVPSAIEETIAVPSVPPAAASITQQYKEKTVASIANHEALYDSAAQGAPLAHPAKKTSGWMWVMWIVLLLAIGAGSTVALYYFKVI